MTHDARPCTAVDMIGQFSVRLGGDFVDLHHGGQRLVAYVAVHRGVAHRSRIATALWPDLHGPAGLARVRDAVYKINAVTPGLICAQTHRIVMGDRVTVDLEEARRVARALLNEADPGSVSTASQLLGDDVLPTWDEDWLISEQQAFSILRLRALERLARWCLNGARFEEAEWACRLVIGAEPYRESAHLLLARVFLGEGNAGQALSALLDFQGRLQRDLCLAPGEGIRQLTQSIRSGDWSPAPVRTLVGRPGSSYSS